MITEISGKTGLLTTIDAAVCELQGLMSSLNETKINIIPYENSWTAGQLFRHVAKSTDAIAKAMRMESRPAERDAGEKIPMLKKTFPHFSSKLKSPDFIVPEEGPYEKQASIEELSKSFERLKENTNKANLIDMAENLPLGAITKLEMLHLVLYHSKGICTR